MSSDIVNAKHNYYPDSSIRLLLDVFVTRSDEIQCQEAALQMVLCADALLNDADASQQYRALFHHFRFCPDCAAEYQMLIELARLEAANQLPQPIHVPPQPLRKQELPNPVEQFQNIFRVFFAGFNLIPAAQTRGAILSIPPVTVDLMDGKNRVELEVDRSSADPALRVLFCRVETTDSQIANSLVSSSVSLETADTGVIVQRQMLNDLGETVFDQIQPGGYSLRLRLVNQEYTIEDIQIP